MIIILEDYVPRAQLKTEGSSKEEGIVSIGG